MSATICTYFKDGKELGSAQIPKQSDSSIRRAIAKHIGVKQYDTIRLSYYKGDINTGNYTTNIFELADRVLKMTEPPPFPPNITIEEAYAEIRKEAEPIP